MDNRPALDTLVQLGPATGVVVTHGVGLTDRVWVRFGRGEIPVRVPFALLTEIVPEPEGSVRARAGEWPRRRE